jgi:hypothetical protein
MRLPVVSGSEAIKAFRKLAVTYSLSYRSGPSAAFCTEPVEEFRKLL